MDLIWIVIIVFLAIFAGIGFLLNSINDELGDIRWILSIAHRSELESYLKDLDTTAQTSLNPNTKKAAADSAQAVRKLIYRK